MKNRRQTIQYLLPVSHFCRIFCFGMPQTANVHEASSLFIGISADIPCLLICIGA
jgi:hypothetical protein